MVKRVYMLMGPTLGHALSGVADADAAQGVTDGWARDITTLGQPFDSSGVQPKAAVPSSLKNWLSKVWGDYSVFYPNSVSAACVNISKANPTVISVAAGDAAKFNNGDSVTFKGTGTALDSAGVLTVAGKAGSTFTVAVDLSLIAADVPNKGTATKLA